MNRVAEQIIPQSEVLNLSRKVDEQSATLVREVYRTLAKKLELPTNEQEALNRLMACMQHQNEWDQALLRNNIFKAAHSLGLKLPSYSF